MAGDITGPYGYPDYQIDMRDLAQLAIDWLQCNAPDYEVCFEG